MIAFAAFILVAPASAQAAPRIERYVLLSNNTKIGTLTVTSDARKVSTDWIVDDNGRGDKLKERIVLGAGKNAAPISWSIEGTGWVGAPVKESFSVEGGKASWQSLDDKGETQTRTAGEALYLPNNGTPWAQGLFLRQLLVAENNRRAVLPDGELRLEGQRGHRTNEAERLRSEMRLSLG